MQTMKYAILTSIVGALALVGCGDDGTAMTGTGGMPGAGGMDGSGATGGDRGPTAAQIDRMGRPAINTALTQTFSPDSVAKEARKDEYNADDDPSSWAEYIPDFAAALAILDSLDTDSGAQAGCGTQLAIGAPTAPGGDTRYDGLARVLVDDQLYVNSATNKCVAYLGVEAKALQLVEDGGCGGRTPSYDVIDTTYSVLAAGLLSGVGDGVDENPEGFLVGFPFLAAPSE